MDWADRWLECESGLASIGALASDDSDREGELKLALAAVLSATLQSDERLEFERAVLARPQGSVTHQSIITCLPKLDANTRSPSVRVILGALLADASQPRSSRSAA